MPTFYFHVRDQSGTVMKDEQGADLANARAAREQAIRTGRRFVRKEVSAEGLHLDDLANLAIEVNDRAGQIVCVVPFSEAWTRPAIGRQSSVSEASPTERGRTKARRPGRG